jgi:ribosomal protein S18 acetylase RimI-like enzyme
MTTNHLIRDFREADFPKIAELWGWLDLGSPKRGDTLDVILRSLDHGGIFLVMEAVPSGEIIGTSWMTNDSRRIYLHHFGIAPACQRQGLGKALLQASLGRAKATGLQIKLEVHRDNQAAIALYRSFGFARLGDYDSYIIRDLNGIPSGAK